jgi:hypothetical protein
MARAVGEGEVVGDGEMVDAAGALVICIAVGIGICVGVGASTSAGLQEEVDTNTRIINIICFLGILSIMYSPPLINLNS